MSAISRALEVRRESIPRQVIRASPLSRWGPPIWRAEEPVQILQRESAEVVPLEVLALVLLRSERSA